LERVVEDELTKREKAQKYTHNMLEDLQVQMKAGFENDNVTDRLMEERLAVSISGQDVRLRTIERLVWIAVGGVLVIGAITSIIGGNILKLLSHA
jgi:hypothetical protein